MTDTPTQRPNRRASAKTGTTAPRIAQLARRARQRSSSALYLIACIFLASAVLRANGLRQEIADALSSSAYAASDTNPGDIAASVPQDAVQAMPANGSDAEAPTGPEAAAKTPPPVTAGESGTASPEMLPSGKSMGVSGMNDDKRCIDGAFLAAALEREQELSAMAMRLDTRRRELEVTEKRVAAQLGELARQQSALESAFGKAGAVAEEEAMQLVSIYEKMKPKQAALIFDQMPPEIGAGFVRRMRQNSSAQIMANMEPQNAYAISLLLAGKSSAVRQK